MPGFKDIEEVRDFIKKTDKDTSIYVGCDSRQQKEKTVFVTVIVVHLSSKHGAKVFWKVEKTQQDYFFETEAYGGSKQSGLPCTPDCRCS